MPNNVTIERSGLGVAVRVHGTDSVEAREARQRLAAAKLERYVAEVLEKAPPLTEDQLDRIGAILRGAR